MCPERVVLPDPPFCDAKTITRIDASMSPPDAFLRRTSPPHPYRRPTVKAARKERSEFAVNCNDARNASFTNEKGKKKAPEATKIRKAAADAS
jgi:hypothetical protein